MEKSNFTFKGNKKSDVLNITVNEQLNTSNILEFHRKLLKNYKNYSNIKLNLKNIENLDVTGIQMIYQLKKYCGNSKTNLEISSQINDNTQNLLENNGIDILKSD